MGSGLLRVDLHRRQRQPGDHQGERVHLRGQRREVRTQGVPHEGEHAAVSYWKNMQEHFSLQKNKNTCKLLPMFLRPKMETGGCLFVHACVSGDAK